MHKYPIRTATKAIIIEDGKILLNKYKKRDIWYTLPGGGQNHNEDLRSNLKRECLEEIGAKVQVNDILFVREFIADRNNKEYFKPGFHQVNIIFECTLLSKDFTTPTEPDPNQVGFEWVDIKSIDEYSLYPLSLRGYIKEHYLNGDNKIYLGETD